MEWLSKKVSIWTILAIYALSFMINSVFFVNRDKASASGNNNLTKIVAVIVDKDLYPSLQSDIVWYTTSYIQSRQADTKAIVLPINIQNIGASDIVKMLENIYFDGIQDVASRLEGIVLIGDIPLPVVQDKGFVYPSIYPYVDFEKQKFIYDFHTQFFVPNNNPNGQAEIWHGWIKFDHIAEYNKYFQKLKKYDNDPSKFVDTQIWYDDFIWMKKYVLAENFNAYINKQIFAEDIGYRRVNNLLFDTLKGASNANASEITTTIQNDLADTQDPELKAYAQMLQDKQGGTDSQLSQMSTSKTPTLFLNTTIAQLTKTYDKLISTKLLTKILENTAAAGRWYSKDMSGNRMDSISSHYEKIVQRDNWILGADPLLIQINSALESGVNQKIASEKYAMKFPLPIQYEEVDHYLLSNKKKNIYDTFYFGKSGVGINNIADLSIYRGGYQNLSELTGVVNTTPEKSIWWSYHILSQQVAANRGFNLLNTENELALWSGTKQYLLHKKDCSIFFIPGTDICIGSTTWDTNYWEDHGFKDIYGKTMAQGTQETPLDFAIRLRWWASPINLDTSELQNNNTYKLRFFSFRHAVSPIYDIAWSQKTTQAETTANSYLAIKTYHSMIKTKDQAGNISYPRAKKLPSSASQDNAVDIQGIPFVPKWTLPYDDVDFFSIYQTNNQWTNTTGTNIMLKWMGTANVSGNADYKIYRYKLIDTRKLNISPTPEEINAMNITTADRPIDSVRNITFQGIWGDVVQFTYPNLYEIPVYKTVGNVLVLKNETEILNAIKAYLQNKVVEYNNALTTQNNKKTQYYQAHSSAFNFLGSSDPLANPNRTYTILSQDFLIQQLLQSIDNLTNRYGNTYIFGKNIPSNNDDKLRFIAKLLLYQNSNRPEKKANTTVAEDIQSLQSNFDINNKIIRITNDYLQSNNNQGAFLSPTYNQTGYEVAYINSDGFDLIDQQAVPAFVQQIYKIKSEKKQNTQPITKSPIEQETEQECGIDPTGTVLLFDFKERNSPWLKAMKCWATKTFASSFKIDINFDSAQGPVFLWFFKNIKESISSRWDERKQTSSDVQQKNAEDNEEILQSSPVIIQDRLLTYAKVTDVKLASHSWSVDDQEPKALTIASFRTLNDTQIRISATGDVCLGLTKGNQTLSANLCKDPVISSLGKDPMTYHVVDIQKRNKAGTMILTTKFCINNSPTRCIAKTDTLYLLPAAIRQLDIQIPTKIIMMWAALPVQISAKDTYANKVWQSIEQYRVWTDTGDINGSPIVDISNFSKWTFLYQAPKQVAENMTVHINISGNNQEGKLVTGRQSIILAKGVLNISYAGQIISSSAIKKNKSIGYHLPATATGIVFTDADNITQIQANAIPKISLRLQDKNGNMLDSVANITSKNWLITPGKIRQQDIDVGGGKKTQTIFQAQSDILIQGGIADIRLYPSMQAGTEELLVQMPGIDPIPIVIHIYPWPANKVNIQLDNDSFALDDTTTQISSGTITVLDQRNNITQTPVTLKVWTIGPWLVDKQNAIELVWKGSPLSFTLQGKKPWGVWHMFAYLKDVALNAQDPGITDFFVQNRLLPQTWLNVMYLNLFGTDRGNQWGYFSQNDQEINHMTTNSDKLLTTTTSLIDPSKIRQIQSIVTPDGQIKTIEESSLFMRIIGGALMVDIEDVADISYGPSASFSFVTPTIDSLAWLAPQSNTLLYLPNKTDSIISSNEIQDKQLVVNGTVVLDLSAATMVSDLSITSNGQQQMGNGFTWYDVIRNQHKLGSIAIYQDTIDEERITLYDSIKYAIGKVFTQWSTNAKQGIGIYDNQSAYSKAGYLSIEDSVDPLAGVWFTSKFKNISYFAAGKTVGQATVPYSSAFLINFGDPLVQRVSESIQVKKTSFDGSLGQEIFTNPDKTIFKVLPADFDNDGLDDLLVSYTDGNVQLLKNYGGKEPFQNLQQLMTIWESIQDIYLGDINDDKYPDILLWTYSNKILAYQNRKGIIDVDGTPVCLNTNVNPGEISKKPNDLSWVHQLFVEDMDQDGNLDIITNDMAGELKLFYGGKDNKGNGYFLSTLPSVCDDNRAQRQTPQSKVLKSFGLTINPNRYIIDDSLVHWKGMPIPDTSTDDTESPENDTNATNAAGNDYDKDTAIAQAENLVHLTNEYIVLWAKDMSYVDNPLDIRPVYETATAEIKYLPIHKLSGEQISVYKTFEDVDGGILEEGDEVQIHIKLLSLANNQKISYIDRLQWPREIVKDDEGKILSRNVEGSSINDIQTHRNLWSEYQVMIDNIRLQKHQWITFSYKVYYQKTNLSKISIQDKDLSNLNKAQDGYLDIIIKTVDACTKSQRVLRNTKSSNQKYRQYQEVFLDLDKKLAEYSSGVWNAQKSSLWSMFQQIDSMNTQNLSSQPAMKDILESWTLLDMFDPWWLSLNLNMNIIDQMTAKLSEDINQWLKGLCEWFTMGKNTCQGNAVPFNQALLAPFNQAFLAPGEYHLFGCVPTAPHPLAAPFAFINRTLGKWVPVFSIPANSTIPLRPPSPPGAGGIFGWSTSQFRLYVAPTLTLGVGIAICLWPYGAGVTLPKPIRDIAGNCIVFAIPSWKKGCLATDTDTSKSADEIDPDLMSEDICEHSPIIGNTITIATNTTIVSSPQATSSPFQTVTIQAWSMGNPIVPQWNFGWLVQINQEPTITISTEAKIANTIGKKTVVLEPWAKVKLKILGSKAKWLVQCLIKDWMTRQLRYIINNLTKMSVEVRLPDMTQMMQGFDELDSLWETYRQLNTEDEEQWYISPSVQIHSGNLLTWLKAQFSQQQWSSISKKIGQNPFDAIAMMFEEVPLINISTKEINLKIPLLTSDEIDKYSTYLKARGDNNKKVLKQWEQSVDKLTARCFSQEMKAQKENLPTIKQNLAKLQNDPNADKEEIEELQWQIAQSERCEKFDARKPSFLEFSKNTAQLFASVQTNIKVLEQYKTFPWELYEWIHISDRYLSEVGAVATSFAGGLTSRLEINANRFSQYVDAITLIVWAIKTWQAIIDFSVDRSEKCSTCSNDNYGSFSCSLSFLCPQLPIFKIPPFKIPDITLDLSHIEVWLDIVLPKFNFVPLKMPLSELPNIPEPPNLDISLDLNALKIPEIPILPWPPQLPALPSFIPNIDFQLPILPPAPKIPKILPEIQTTLKVAEFIGKIFCIVKWGIGLVGEKWVKARIEQLTQRKWNVPVFDFFDLTTKYQDPPLQWFDYTIDAYARLKYNFEGVYTVLDGLAQSANQFVVANIETPMQWMYSWWNATVKNVNDKIEEGEKNVDIDVELDGSDLNWFVPIDSPGIEYADAYKQLQKELVVFQSYAYQNKKVMNQIQEIQRTVDKDSTVTAATADIEAAKDVSLQIVQQKQQEIKTLAEDIQHYDNFVEHMRKQNIQLVSKQDDIATTISAPLIKISESTKQLIAQQKSPNETYLAINQQLIQGYQQAISNGSPESLNMTTDTYQKSVHYLDTLWQKVKQAMPADKTLIAGCVGDTCPSSPLEANGYKQDLWIYTQGVFVQTGKTADDTDVMVRVINNQKVSDDIWQHYLQTDINNDQQKDLLLWDNNSIYAKYADQQDSFLSAGGNKTTRQYGKYFAYQQGNTWWIDSASYLDEATKDGLATFGDIQVKIWDTFTEIKNFANVGQSYENLQLSWRNSIAAWEPLSGYIIKISYQVDTFVEKIKTVNFFGIDTTPIHYILVLPQDTSYMTGLLSVDTIQKRPIKALLTGDVRSVKYFDPSQQKIDISITEAPSKWLYVQIAALKTDPSQLSKKQQKSLTLYSPWWPRSNQIVVGKQLLADNKWPDATISFQRVLTNETISTGNSHQGWINTNYRLLASRTDTNAITHMTIEHNGQVISSKHGTSLTGTIEVPNLFFTGMMQDSYVFQAIDANNNLSKEVVNFTIQIPNISIIDVQKVNEEYANIIAELEQDLDEGLVSFQRERNGMIKEITGSKANTLWWYALSPGKTIITWWLMKLSNLLGIYAPNWETMGSIDPENGEILIADAYQDDIFLQLDFLLHIPTIKIIQKSSQRELFQIALPTQKMENIAMIQGKPTYQLISLEHSQFGTFQWGKCIQNQNKECIIYVNKEGKMYIPNIYSTMLWGTYGFDKENKAIVYTIHDENNKAIASIAVHMKPLFR